MKYSYSRAFSLSQTLMRETVSKSLDASSILKHLISQKNNYLHTAIVKDSNHKLYEYIVLPSVIVFEQYILKGF
jgi:hypothetical protein